MKIVNSHAQSRRSRRRRRRLRSLAFVPTLLTLGNLLCGFAAIYFGLRAIESGAGLGADSLAHLQSGRWERMLPSFLSVGAGLVFLGMVFDGFDGLIARMTRNTTDFGGQLDSLADVVTCGVAPAILMLVFMRQQLAGDALAPSPLSGHFLGRVAWASAAVYVAFAALRLARYNVEHSKSEFDHQTFRGLPSPGAAAVIVAMLIFQDQCAFMFSEATAVQAKNVFLFALPAGMFAMALLMVSPIPYRRLDRTYLVGRRPFGQFVFLLVILAIFWSQKAPTLLVLTVLFALSGPLLWVVGILREKAGKGAAPSEDQSQAEDRKLA